MDIKLATLRDITALRGQIYGLGALNSIESDRMDLDKENLKSCSCDSASWIVVPQPFLFMSKLSEFRRRLSELVKVFRVLKIKELEEFKEGLDEL